MHITQCRFCKSTRLVPYLDLGLTPLADRFLTAEQLREPEVHYPLVVMLCLDCGLSQLSYTVDPKLMYQEDYPYSMSRTKTGEIHYGNFAASVVKKFGLTKKDLVVDIGSNVGILLDGFKKLGVRVLGIDPAQNMAAIANKNGIPTIPDFFVPAVAKKAHKKYGAAKVVMGTNVFAHIFDHFQFIEGLKLLLDKKGVFIFESPSFVNLVKNLEYDTIYHEHLLYLSLRPVITFFKKYGMEVFDVENHLIHGGSFRVFVARKGDFKIAPTVARQLELEKKSQIHSLPRLRKFAKDVENNRFALTQFVHSLRRRGKRIAALSTPAKGMTLLNYTRLGYEHIEFATEKSPHKIGKFTPGTHIPIFGDEELLRRKPDYALLLAWNFSKEIIRNMGAYKKAGGKFIIPVPKPRVSRSGESSIKKIGK